MIKLERSRRVLRFLRQRWKRVTLCVVALLITGYSVAFAAVEWSESPTDQIVQLTDGRQLAYRVLNDAAESDSPRVILVHGAPADAGSWDTLARRCDLGDREVLAVDRLGYGNSSPGIETSLEAHAQSLEPLLTPGVVLVGHSYGGPVVLRAAAEYPDLVSKIVLVAGACDPYMNDSEWFREGINGIRAIVPHDWEASNRELLALTDENREMEDLLDRVRCEVVIVHGTWDPVCPHDGTVGYLRQSLVNAEVDTVSLARAGHNLHLGMPQRVWELVRR